MFPNTRRKRPEELASFNEYHENARRHTKLLIPDSFIFAKKKDYQHLPPDLGTLEGSSFDNIIDIERAKTDQLKALLKDAS